MLGEAFSAVGTAFSSRFLLGQFFPVFIFLAANLLLACVYIWGIEPSLTYAKDHLQIASLTTVTGLVATIACAVAFTIAPLVGALEGAFFVGKLRERLLTDVTNSAAATKQVVDGRRSDQVLVNQTCDATRLAIPPLAQPIIAAPPAAPDPHPPSGLFSWRPWLRHVDRQSAAATPQPPDPADIAANTEAARVALNDLKNQQRTLDDLIDDESRSRKPDWKNVCAQMTVVITAMTTAQAALSAIDATPGDRKTYSVLQTDFIGSQERAKKRVARQFSEVASEHLLDVDPDNLKPTRFGNLKAALEAYPVRVYSVDFDYLWPRLLLVIAKDDPNSGLLDQRRAQLDFTLLAMLLVMIAFIGWLIGLLATDDVIWRFPIVAAAAPVTMWLFYEIALAAQRSFTELAKGFFDRYRFALLKVMHATLPVDPDAERLLWKNLAGAAAGYRQKDKTLAFDHTP